MKRILLVGETPLGTTGNSNMMRALLSQLDREKYNVAVYGVPAGENIKLDFYQFPPYQLIPAFGHKSPEDKWGGDGLMTTLQEQPIDAMITVGIDIWTYAPYFQQIEKVRRMKKFLWISIFPYDAMDLRKDWVQWINQVQFPFVYSKYGENMLKESVPNIKYFRPPLFFGKFFGQADPETRRRLKKKYFPTLSDDTFLFGFVGNNQIRKDPQRVLIAYNELKKDHPNAMLYLHTEMERGVYNLSQMCLDLGLKTGDIISKGSSKRTWVDPRMMVEIYNCLDALINTSLQEGLSWTLVESMLSGVPIIASDTTAQTELVKNVGLMIPCNELTFLPVIAGKGQSWVRAKCCKVEDITDAMKQMMDDGPFRQECIQKGLKKGNEWLKGQSNINELLGSCESEVDTGGHLPYRMSRYDKVLFCQHSSAGDILMTTRCMKGLKERYNKPIVYMTQRQYMDIVMENPYIDEVIEWDEHEPQYYNFTLNPHAERILPGHWGRNSNVILSDFYWKIMMLRPDDFYIHKKMPDDIGISGKIKKWSQKKPICILHTTGGDADFRTYMYMSDISKALDKEYYTVQLGSKHDFPADAKLDLRGQLSFRESAWVMDHASLAVTVDSFVSHLAGALGVSQVCLFGSGNVHVVRPNQVKGELICLVPDYIMDCPGLGPCSGAIRNCPAPCTGIHDPSSILRAIKQIEKNGMVRRNDAHDKAPRYSFKYVQRN